MRSVYRLFISFLSFSAIAQIPINEVIQASFTPLSYCSSGWADYDNDGDYDVAIMGQTQLGSRVCNLYRNNSDSTFTDMLAGLPGLAFGALAWNDYDNDGDVDLAISGKDGGGVSLAYIYSNSSGSFSNSAIALTGLSIGSVSWHDYNCDGRTDLLLTGQDDSGTARCLLYKQGKNNTFELEDNFTIEGLRSSFATWADFNNDGRKDLIVQGENSLNNKKCLFYKALPTGSMNLQSVTGISGLTDGQIATSDIDADGKIDFAISGIDVSSNQKLEVYRNLGNFLFTKVATLTGVGSSSIAFGDMDNDGDADLMYSGQSSSSYETGIYRNNGNLTFSNQLGFTGTYAGSLRLADFDNDEDLDFLLSGASSGSNYTTLSRNLSSTDNTAPAAPTTLTETVWEDSVLLSWDASADANGGSLSYNIFIGTSKTNQQIVSSNSNITTGFHATVGEGNIGTISEYRIYNLEQGKYYWSVQAIDNNFKPSDFAIIDSFVVCKRFSIGNDTVLCDNDNINLSAGVSGDVVNWYSKQTPLIATNTLSISYPVTVNDTIWAQRYNSVSGCLTYDTINVRVNAVPTINPGSDSSICLGTSLVLGGSPTASTSIFTNSYKWYPSYGMNDSTLANPTAQPTVDTIYHLIVRSGTCKPDTVQVSITIDALPEVIASSDTIIGFGESASISGSGAITYAWSPITNVTGSLTPSPVVTPGQTTLYTVTGTDINGCQDTADVLVTVDNRFFIPDLFSPDGNGKNDKFLVYGVGIDELTFRIYNQSGLEIFSSSDVALLTTIGWDGKVNGKTLNGQAFLWTMEGKYVDGSEITYKGKKTGILILKR